MLAAIRTASSTTASLIEAKNLKTRLRCHSGREDWLGMRRLVSVKAAVVQSREMKNPGGSRAGEPTGVQNETGERLVRPGTPALAQRLHVIVHVHFLQATHAVTHAVFHDFG